MESFHLDGFLERMERSGTLYEIALPVFTGGGTVERAVLNKEGIDGVAHHVGRVPACLACILGAQVGNGQL